MASGDTLESIEVLQSNSALNMNNSKEPPGIDEAGADGESDGMFVFQFAFIQM